MSRDFLRTRDDVLNLLDDLLDGQGGDRWDALFADRATPRPFLVDDPDENLVEWVEDGRLPPGRALELGPGNGRNAVYLAERSWTVDAVDFSAEAVAWTGQRAAAAGVVVGVQHRSIFDLDHEPGCYDLVYDAGCLHHIAPHRRPDYVELVRGALRPGGAFGLVCFRPEGGSGRTDREVYEHRSLGGGLGYTEEQLRLLLADGFAIEVLRQMRTGLPERFGGLPLGPARHPRVGRAGPATARSGGRAEQPSCRHAAGRAGRNRGPGRNRSGVQGQRTHAGDHRADGPPPAGPARDLLRVAVVSGAP